VALAGVDERVRQALAERGAAGGQRAGGPLDALPVVQPLEPARRDRRDAVPAAQ
jgi:hypothetical protein